MIDPGLEESARDKLAQDARGRIEADGSLKHENAWGLRKMAYEIRQRTEADYRWYRFEASPELLQGLDHNLKITDGVLRFRIFKVDPEAPVLGAPPAGASSRAGDRGDRATEVGAATAVGATAAASPTASSASPPRPRLPRRPRHRPKRPRRPTSSPIRLRSLRVFRPPRGETLRWRS